MLLLLHHFSPPPPRKRKKGGKKKRKKENSSYALYLISKIICDRPFSFFPFFTCITYRIDRLRDNVILLLRTYYPNPSGFFFLVRLFLHFNFTGLTNVLIKEKTEWNPLLDVHTGASSCKWSILTPGKMYQKNVQKSVIGARLLFWLLNYCFFDVLVAVAVALVGF